MSLETIAARRSTPTGLPELDTDFTPNLVWHRDRIHPKAQHGCGLCPPTPCVCGWSDGTCPDYFEHRRGDAGSETSWREVAA
jgi:hypothetical protein